MALTALNQMAESTLKNLSYGMQGWIQNSAVTWLSTAVAFYGVKFARECDFTTIKEVEAAKFIVLACTTHSIMQGIFADRKDLDIAKLLNKQWIALANAAALALYGAHRLNIALNTLPAFVVTALSYIVTKMVYNTHTEKKRPNE